MSALLHRLVALATLSFAVLALSPGVLSPLVLSPGVSTTALVAGLALLAIAALVVAQGTSAQGLELEQNARAREHRQRVVATPSPAHPNTVGRVRARAPGIVLPAT